MCLLFYILFYHILIEALNYNISLRMKILYTFFLLLFVGSIIYCQDPWRFRSEIEQFDLLDQDRLNKENLIVFTGSSSIRFWQSLVSDFPDYNVINRGFGGSEMSDLNYFWDKLILLHQPTKVFIYEGDNDINSGKSIEVIMEGYKYLAQKMAKYLPNTKLYLISPKPSVARWHLKDKYEQLNYSIALWVLWEPNITFIDVWTPMCDDKGEVKKDLFIGDMLHMNDKGYKIWASTVRPFIEE